MKVTLETETDFTPAALMRWLNTIYREKKSGVPFTMGDIQQYEMRGNLPRQYGGNQIERIESDEIGLKILRVKP